MSGEIPDRCWGRGLDEFEISVQVVVECGACCVEKELLS